MSKAETPDEKLARYRGALSQFIERIEGDRYVLAVILNGSLSLETIWRKHAIDVWVIEADGVSRRLRSDGKDERLFRTLVEDEVNIHAELIPRSRFKQMVEGSSRTAFSCNFFAARHVEYCRDPSIESWFEQANTVATKDQQRELLMFSTWAFYTLRRAKELLNERKDVELAQQQILDAAHSLAYTEVIRSGTICEGIVIHKAVDLNPEIFDIIYSQVLSKRKNKKVLQVAIDAIETYLETHHEEHLRPLIAYLRKQNRTVPLSEIGDHFAFSQVYPWHLEAACEWLYRTGKLEKLSSPFKLTKRSSEEAEEPAYYWDI